MRSTVFEDYVKTRPCDHLLAVRGGPIPDVGCAECIAAGDTWIHLRYCTECEQVRCCDDSPNQHAAQHAQESGHNVIRSAEPGEMWAYCYTDEAMLLDIAFAKYMQN